MNNQNLGLFEIYTLFGTVSPILSHSNSLPSIALPKAIPIAIGSVWDGGYRYGFNGKEKEIELNESITSAEFWMYDGRLGRRWNQDVVERSNFSPYGVLANNPIIYIDAEGNDWYLYSKKFLFINYSYKIVWVYGNSVIYDPAKHNYEYLGTSLTFLHLYKCAIMSYGKEAATIMVAPILGYHAALNSDILKNITKNGYNDYGGYLAEKPDWLHKGYPNKSFGTNMSKVFMANDKITVKNFYTIIMTSFLYGVGPENFYFDTEHEVSKSLTDSKLVTDALNMYKDKDNNSEEAKKLRNGEWVAITVGLLSLPDILERAKKDGTNLNPEHLIGSAQVRITISEDGTNYIISIWNVTSLGSGTKGIDSQYRPSTIDNTPQPYTNVSQSYELVIPIK